MTQTISTGVVIILSMALLIFLFVYYARKQEQKQKMRLMQEFQQVANLRCIDATHMEIYRNRIIGFDEKVRTILYTTHKDGEYGSTVLQLNKPFSCEIVKVGTKIFDSPKQRKDHLHVLEIQLHIAFPREQATIITLYDEIEEGAINLQHYLEVAGKWEQLLRNYYL